jgi:hypothetical protein
MTSIHLDIEKANLGPLSSPEDHERYRAAVETRLQSAYADDEVSVGLADYVDRDRVFVDGPSAVEEEQIQETVRGIAQDVFNRGGW